MAGMCRAGGQPGVGEVHVDGSETLEGITRLSASLRIPRGSATSPA